jgi:hypothetical protein
LGFFCAVFDLGIQAEALLCRLAELNPQESAIAVFALKGFFCFNS